MTLEDKITHFLNQVLEKSYFVVDVKITNPEKTPKLLILLDGDKGINIGVCAQITKKLNKFLDEQQLVERAYTLEVSSVGADTPLKMQRQYPQHIGRNLLINTKKDTSLEGRFQNITEEGIELVEIRTSETKNIKWEDIQEAKVQISFK